MHDKNVWIQSIANLIKFLFPLGRKKTLCSREESQAVHVPVAQVHRSHAQVRERILQHSQYEGQAAASII